MMFLYKKWYTGGDFSYSYHEFGYPNILGEMEIWQEITIWELEFSICRLHNVFMSVIIYHLK